MCTFVTNGHYENTVWKLHYTLKSNVLACLFFKNYQYQINTNQFELLIIK